MRSSFWLAGMLIKPYTLIQMLAGLAVNRRWRVLYGFRAGLLIAPSQTLSSWLVWMVSLHHSTWLFALLGR